MWLSCLTITAARLLTTHLLSNSSISQGPIANSVQTSLQTQASRQAHSYSSKGPEDCETLRMEALSQIDRRVGNMDLPLRTKPTITRSTVRSLSRRSSLLPSPSKSHLKSTFRRSVQVCLSMVSRPARLNEYSLVVHSSLQLTPQGSKPLRSTPSST